MDITLMKLYHYCNKVVREAISNLLRSIANHYPRKPKTLDARWCSKHTDRLYQQKQKVAFARDLFTAFKEQIHTDILVNPGNNVPSIPAHKFVLAARSKVFKKMLECNEGEASPNNIITITIPNLTYEELESLLEFLYTGTLPTKKLDKYIYALSLAADKYEITHLKKYCERYMLTSISIANALDFLEIAETCSNQFLKGMTFNFLVENMGDIVSSSRFEVFVYRNPHLAIQLTTRAFLR